MVDYGTVYGWYGRCEIVGMEKDRKMEGIHERFLRWTMGVGLNFPGNMLRKKVGTKQLVIRQRKRVMWFEDQLEQGKGSKVQKCWRRIK